MSRIRDNRPHDAHALVTIDTRGGKGLETPHTY